MRTPKIKDCFPLVNGIWSKINYDFPDAFEVDSSQLDIMFLSNWGLRTPAPIVRIIHDSGVQLPLSSQELETLAGVINGMFKHKWDKMMDVAMMEYDPIHNYNDHLVESITYSEDVDGTKSVTGSNSNTRTDNLRKTETDLKGYTHTYNLSDARTDNLQKIDSDTRGYTDTFDLTETRTDDLEKEETRNLNNTGNDSQADNIYGFNSSTAVGDRNSSGTNSNLESGTVTTEDTGTQETTKEGTQSRLNSGQLTETNTGTQTTLKTGTEGRSNSGTLTEENTGTQTNAGSNSTSETSGNETTGEKTREYTKTGNIGNISTQKLLNEELDLWKYNFIYEMMRDVAKFVTLPIYEQ